MRWRSRKRPTSARTACFCLSRFPSCRSSRWQPDWNWQNADVADHFDRALTFWFDRDVEGFRVDAIGYVGKEDGLPDADVGNRLHAIVEYASADLFPADERAFLEAVGAKLSPPPIRELGNATGITARLQDGVLAIEGSPWDSAAVVKVKAGSTVRIDLRTPPFAARREAWTDPADYTACQALARDARICADDIPGSDSTGWPQARSTRSRYWKPLKWMSPMKTTTQRLPAWCSNATLSSCSTWSR